MANSKTWSSSRVNFRAFVFQKKYINDLPPTINTLSEPTLFTDDTSVIISSKNFDDFSTMSNTVLPHMSKWFAPNKLVLNLDKTDVIKFITHKSPQYDLKTGYDEKCIEASINTKFQESYWSNDSLC
jgi:hypothetical protein